MLGNHPINPIIALGAIIHLVAQVSPPAKKATGHNRRWLLFCVWWCMDVPKMLAFASFFLLYSYAQSAAFPFVVKSLKNPLYYR